MHPQSRIGKLPKVMRLPAVLLRNFRDIVIERVIMRHLYGFTYHSDGMATTHYSPFVDDPEFERAFAQMSRWWYQDRVIDVRWRMWILTQSAKQCGALPGNFAEFGVYRGGCAYMILSLTELADEQSYFLFDTFEGIPESNLTEAEKSAGFAGRLADTTVQHVADVLSRWKSHLAFVEGDVFKTLDGLETGPLAFCHLDLNASAPTVRAIEYVYPRLLPSAMVVLDDYTQFAYSEQRKAIDAFLQDKPERVLALPTGQGLLVKM